MADNPNIRKLRASRIRKDISNPVGSPSEKVTAVPVHTPPKSVAETSSYDEIAAVAYTPAIVESRVIPMHSSSVPEKLETAVVSSLVSLARFARRKPAVSLAIAAAAGFASGLAARRI